MIKDPVRRTLCTLAGCWLLLVACQPQSSDRYPESVLAAAEAWGVPPERITVAAAEMGIDIEEITGPFFPVDYYMQQFRRFEQEHGRLPTLGETEQMMKGYWARCYKNVENR